MNISPRSTSWWSSALALVGVVALAVGQPPQKSQSVPPFLEEFQASKPRDLRPFLDDFNERTEPAIVTETVEFIYRPAHDRWPRQLSGYWARAAGKQPLPVVLVLFDEGAPATATWMRTNAQQLASIGYAVLAMPLPVDFPANNTHLQVVAYMQWLRGRKDVVPGRLGVVGFGLSGRQSLLLASSRPVQACILCDAWWRAEPELIRGLRGTPVLAVHGAADPHSSDAPAFAKALSAQGVPCKLHEAPKSKAGFLGPPESKAYNHDAAEDAWVAIYNFLEKYVEDAKPAETVVRPAKSALTIADMMRSVNDPSGVRGALSKALEAQPKSARQWGQVRAHAALIAELGAWLQTQTPPKGPAGHWQEQAQAFTAAASAIVDAAERRDHAAAQRRLAELAGKCAACHNEHR